MLVSQEMLEDEAIKEKRYVTVNFLEVGGLCAMENHQNTWCQSIASSSYSIKIIFVCW